MGHTDGKNCSYPLTKKTKYVYDLSFLYILPTRLWLDLQIVQILQKYVSQCSCISDLSLTETEQLYHDSHSQNLE